MIEVRELCVCHGGQTILQNVCLYGRIHGRYAQAQEEARKSFAAFGLAGCEDLYPRSLSGGMRQRAAFLRTSLCSADILLLDEPFGALDVISRGDMQDWLLSMRRRLSRTALLVTHDVDEAIYLSNRILVLGGNPAGIVREFVIPEENRSREWLFSQGDLRAQIYRCIKGDAP
ncbi:MAG: ABC transporter ATP-binding protein [Clostridia bacterium]|nr:ABC transporter ATP-binding protein [Clostridia bacterium]